VKSLLDRISDGEINEVLFMEMDLPNPTHRVSERSYSAERPK
jgi:hypothetical protein